MLYWLTFSRGNPVNREPEPAAWMFEVRVLNSFRLMVLFFAVASGLGVYIGSTWQKARQNPAALQAELSIFPT